MILALIDNGSLEPAAHLNLRAAAVALSARAAVSVIPVSWRHSDRIPEARLGGRPAPVLIPWVRAQLALGERRFLFIPFFVSPQGAVGSALREELEVLSAESGGFVFGFTPGLSDKGVLGAIVAGRVRETIAAKGLLRPPVVVVDHGGPSRISAELRDGVAADALSRLGHDIRAMAVSSLESPDGPEFGHNRPLFAEKLGSPGFDRGDVVAAPLFLSPGRHAGPAGDLAAIAAAAEAGNPGLRIHFADLVGTHPLALDALGRGLEAALRP